MNGTLDRLLQCLINLGNNREEQTPSSDIDDQRAM